MYRQESQMGLFVEIAVLWTLQSVLTGLLAAQNLLYRDVTDGDSSSYKTAEAELISQYKTN